MVDDLIDRIDALQRRWKFTSFLWAVQKKYGDDRGGYLAALVTYYGFLSIFPLLLAAFTVIAYVFSGDASVSRTIERHIGSYPIIGPAASGLGNNTLHGRPVALIIGVVGLIWGSQGLAQACQFSMDEAWSIPNKSRPGFIPRTLRSFGWYAVFGIGVLISTSVSSLGSVFHWAGGPVLSTLASFLVDIGIFLVSFRILTPSSVPLRDLRLGAVVAGAVWAVLTGVGVGLVKLLAHSNPLYGSFTSVLALLGFIYLTARITILAVEASAVRAKGLYPRSLTSRNLTPADLRQLEQLAGKEERVKPEKVQVDMEESRTA